MFVQAILVEIGRLKTWEFIFSGLGTGMEL
jgi:hypothetical protein